jgi:hypothetical protein
MDKVELIQRWRGDPALFAREALNFEPWAKQRDIMRAVFTHPRVAVKSGHKIGKSRLAAGCALGFVSLYPGARVIMTSASARQIRSILWREIGMLLRGARLPLGTELARDPGTGIQFPDGREIVGFSTNEPERMAGISGANVLFIIDEASGVPEPIFEAIEGNRAGGARVLLLSNPTKLSGEFHAAFHGKRQFYKLFTVSSRMTPNATGVGKPRPGLATKEWCDEKAIEWGVESSLYQVRVDGEFPRQGASAVIPLAWVEEALERMLGYLEEPFEPSMGLDVGVDPGRFGDDPSAVAAVRGELAYPIRQVRNLDGPELAGFVLDIVREMRQPGEKVRIKVDDIGIGASCYDALNPKHNDTTKALGLEVHAVSSSEKATSDGYSNLRAQLWFGIREWIRDGLLHSDSQLEAELVATEYGFDARGRRTVTKKDDLKTALGRSPNSADALALAVYNPPKAKPLPRAKSRGWEM